MKCPKCGLENPPSALRCDCGYDFPSDTVKVSYLSPGEREKTSRLTRWYWPKASPATYESALVFGWFLVICAVVYVGIAVVSYIRTSEADLTTIAAWVTFALLTLGTGLAVLKKRKFAVRLVWWWIILLGLGVVGAGFPPLYTLVWAAFLWVAKWYSTKKPLLTG